MNAGIRWNRSAGGGDLLPVALAALLTLAMPAGFVFSQIPDGPDIRGSARFEVIEREGIHLVTRIPDGLYASYDDLPVAVKFQRASARASTPGIAPVSTLTTFVVADAGDAADPDLTDGTYSPPTLRSAIQNANNLGGAHSIAFSAGLTIIQPGTALPAVNVPMNIDGSVAAGKIIIDGSLAPSNQTGLLLGGTSTIRNVEFRNWAGGIGLALGFGAAASVIQRNVFTLNRVGLNINGANVLIGGPDPADRNYAHGNSQDGIAIVFANDVTVRNNFCGTPDGTSPDPNDNTGLYVLGARARVLGNLLSGNGGEGLEIGEFSFNTLVSDNIVGTDSSRRARLGNGGDGMNIFGDADSVLNNVIADNDYGITVLSQASGTYIRGNIIGPNGTLDSLFGNRFGGLQVLGGGVVIDSNIVSGNGYYGIKFSGWGGSMVRGNLIGTDPSGTLGWGNSSSGVFIVADTITVGGPDPSDRNLISGNGGAGVELYGGLSLGGDPRRFKGNVVRGNLIGTDNSGAAKLPNLHGIILTGFLDSNVIVDNLISGNARHGIWFRQAFGASAGGTAVRVNRIGTSIDGVTPLPNDSAGILIDASLPSTIGGTDESDRNIVAFNGLAGVIIKAGAGTRILGNSIFKNGGLGIDLGNDGPTPNDSADADSGAHNLQNYPRLTWIGQSGGSTTVKGHLRSLPGADYRLEFFTSDEADTTGFGEGQAFQYSTDVHIDTGGVANFEFTIPGTYGRIAATATHPVNGTSEFSKSPLIVNSSADRGAANPQGGTAATSGPQVDGVPEVTLRSAIQASNHVRGDDDILFNIAGPAPHFIQPSTPHPDVLDDILIDGTTQPGYLAGEIPPVRLLGNSAGAAADGLSLRGAVADVRGLHISAFAQDGISMSGGRLSLTDISAIANKSSGVRAGGDVTVSGVCFFSANGPSTDRSSVECRSGERAGLWIAGSLKGTGEITANGNCGGGIRQDGSAGTGDEGVALEGVLATDGNSGEGLFANGDVTLKGESFQFLSNGTPTTLSAGVHLAAGSLRIETTGPGDVPRIRANGNSLHGIWSDVGPVRLIGKSQFNNNGAGVSDVRRFNNVITGLIAGGNIRVNTVEASGNGYDGIKTGGSLIVEGDATVRNHAGRGIWAIDNIDLDGSDHLLENNNDQGMWAANGSIVVKGRLTARGNRLGGRHGSEEGSTPANAIVGAVLAYRDFIGEEVVIEDNEPSGLTAWRNIVIRGDAAVRRNSGRGIFAMDELLVEGGLHDISNNGGDGLSVNNGTVRVTGHLTADGNGTDAALVAGGEGSGVWGRIVDIRDASVRNNARHGVVGLVRAIVRGRGVITGNGGSGIASNRFISISGGRVCENAGYGLLSPIVRVSGTQVCNNGLGGISGKVTGPASLVPSFESPDDGLHAAGSGSEAEGVSLTGNGGDGIGVDSLPGFNIGGSNISGNAGLAINNEGSGAVTAEGNWWGNAAGPAGQVGGSVQASTWLTSPVGVYAGSALDTIFVSAGETDSISIAVAGWANPDDSISVSVSDAQGWVTSVDSQTVVLADSTPSTMGINYSIPPVAAGEASRVIVEAASMTTPGAASVDTIHLVVYAPAIAEVRILADTLGVHPGDSIRVAAIAIDQAGREITFIPLWSASGGTVSPDGIYSAGPDTGVYFVHVMDSVGAFADSAVVVIVDPADSSSAPTPDLSANSLALGDVAVGASDTVSFTLSNQAGDILRIDSIRTQTARFNPVYFPDITQLRAGDTLEVAVAFTPDTLGTLLDTLEIFTNAAGPALLVALSGNGTLTGIDEGDRGVPAAFVLEQNFPNPFNPSTTISYALPVRSSVTLRIYDMLGREVAVLADGIEAAGVREKRWGGANAGGTGLSSGVYVYRFDAVSVTDGAVRFTRFKKMILMK